MTATVEHGLIFDVDGVIADTEAINATATIRVLEDLFGISGVVRDDFADGVGRGAAAYVRAAARIHGVELSDEKVSAATSARQNTFLNMLAKEPLPAFPGVLELIHEALIDDGFAVAIATSSTREKSQAVLESAGIPYENMVYVTGSDVSHKKPHPELFLTAAEGLGLPPGKCVVIEDAPNGIESAHAAGCICVAVTNSFPASELTQSDRIVDSLAQIDLSVILELVKQPGLDISGQRGIDHEK